MPDFSLQVALTQITQALAEQGWLVLPKFFPTNHVQALRAQALSAWQAGEFHPAAIGQGANKLQNFDIRNDSVLWLESAQGEAVAYYLDFLEQLRLALNSELFLGVFESEAHFAVYPRASFYKKHLDNFRGRSTRLVTVITYLNHAWQAEDGGQLRLYTSNAAFIDIAPEAGSLVVFLSERFSHEVLPAQRERLSVTGWLRRRS
ncbi:2OG-Fe(II) oxygenase [Thiolinea disciformis]|uniref:2OG-Fe(II) oxygenase n=1 Tax=Thiolinea disciformis TaxID=125614 RepID=UPI000362584E|nr:2OG-Fe(II) oxygenase [Thiolinea disciformis]